jgi:hypothetical protein
VLFCMWAVMYANRKRGRSRHFSHSAMNLRIREFARVGECANA